MSVNSERDREVSPAILYHHIHFCAGYQLNHPLLGRVTAYEPPRETEKTKNMSINWILGDDRAELTDGTLGKTTLG